MAVAGSDSMSIRYRPFSLASHSRAASSSVTLTVPAESKAVVARSVRVVFVPRSYRPTATVPVRFARAAVDVLRQLVGEAALADVQLTAVSAAVTGAALTADRSAAAPRSAASGPPRPDIR